MTRKDKTRKRGESAKGAPPRTAASSKGASSKGASSKGAPPRPGKAARRSSKTPASRTDVGKTKANRNRKARRTGRGLVPAAASQQARRTPEPEARRDPEAKPNPKPRSNARRATAEEKPLPVDRLPSEPPPELIPSALRDDDDAGFSDADVDSEEAFELGIGARVVPPTTQYGEAFESTPPPEAVERKTGDVEAQIRALEARLDGLIRQRETSDAADAEAEEDAAPSSGRRAGPLVKTGPGATTRANSEPAVDGFVARKWGRGALRSRSEDFDDFGLDPSFERRVQPAIEFLYKSYFRNSVEGIDNVPAEGRCIVVANHSGALPLDGPMLRTALRLEHPQRRDLRWLAEDFVYYLPFAGVFMNRVGAVRACPENAERLLQQESLVAVFPEGVHGIKKLFRERYHLQRFGRGGYIRLCLRMRAPIVPCAIIGAEESSPLLYRLEGLTELLGLPYFPITPTFPLLGPLGLLPAPAKWRMRFGEPIHLDSYGPEAADDHVLVGRLSERVRSAIQAMLDSGLRERRSVWFG